MRGTTPGRARSKWNHHYFNKSIKNSLYYCCVFCQCIQWTNEQWSGRLNFENRFRIQSVCCRKTDNDVDVGKEMKIRKENNGGGGDTWSTKLQFAFIIYFTFFFFLVRRRCRRRCRCCCCYWQTKNIDNGASLLMLCTEQNTHALYLLQ